jgi:hypothetical protein
MLFGMLFADRARVAAALGNFVSPIAEWMRSTGGYTIAHTSSIIFLMKHTSSERTSFERMMLAKLNRGSDGLIGRLHPRGECDLLYFIAV